MTGSLPIPQDSASKPEEGAVPEMVARVARAIRAVGWQGPFPAVEAGTATTMARAAIEAMRGTSDGMVEAAMSDRLAITADDDGFLIRPARIWRAMIDAALEQHPPGQSRVGEGG